MSSQSVSDVQCGFSQGCRWTFCWMAWRNAWWIGPLSCSAALSHLLPLCCCLLACVLCAAESSWVTLDEQTNLRFPRRQYRLQFHINDPKLPSHRFRLRVVSVANPGPDTNCVQLACLDLYRKARPGEEVDNQEAAASQQTALCFGALVHVKNQVEAVLKKPQIAWRVVRLYLAARGWSMRAVARWMKQTWLISFILEAVSGRKTYEAVYTAHRMSGVDLAELRTYLKDLWAVFAVVVSLYAAGNG